MENIRFGYFEVATNQGKGYICVALKRPAKGDPRHEAAFAYCSPKEKVFSKKLARSIAQARLEKNKKVVFDHYGGIKGAFVKALGNAAVGSVSPRPDVIPTSFDKGRMVPGWVKKNMHRGSMSFGLRGQDKRPTVSWNRHNFQVGYIQVSPTETIIV